MTTVRNIYFFYPPLAHPVGGMRVAYRHVDLLNKLGYRAWMVHPERGFRCIWFANETAVMAAQDVQMKPADLCVLPEIFEPARLLAYPGIKRLIFNQGAYLTFQNHPWQQSFTQTPYHSPDVVGAIVVSEDNRNYLNYAFPRLRLFRYRLSVDYESLTPRWPRRKVIAFMPRKAAGDLLQVINILKFRGLLDGYELWPIDGLPHAEVCERLVQTEIFLCSGLQEGCSMPPMEAMAAGCLAVGYHGFGGREYMRPEFSFPVEPSNVQEFARTLERVIRRVREDPETLRSMASQAAEFIRKEYSKEREEATVADIWRDVFALLPPI